MVSRAGADGLAARRRTVFIGVLLAALALLPVAIAWACNPQAHISLDRTTYTPGSTITVYGSFFPSNSTITVTGPTGSTTAQTGSGGGFVATLTAPQQSGSYTITATRPTGGFAPASFSVAQPAAPAPTQGRPAPPRSDPAPATREPIREPAVTRSERVPPQAPRSDAGPSQPGGSAAPVQSPGITTTATGQPAFGASAAPAATEGFGAAPGTTVRAGRGDRAARRSAGGSRNAATPSQQAAFSDVWSAFEPGRTPSLTTTGAAASGGAGSELAWGIGLLALGLFSLVGGLAYTEARRRRPA